MKWLNYHHLHYFWLVAREGSLGRASAELRLAPSTVSGQIRELELALGRKLFSKKGRGLALTDVGRTTFDYADRIFSLGRELVNAVEGGQEGRPLRLTVGVADVLPKSIVKRLLEPAFRLTEPVRILCREGRSVEEFAGELASQKLDVVLADTPAPSGLAVRAFNHLLGECGTTLLAASRVAARYRSRFPRSLDGAPVLLPSVGSTLRRGLDLWFESEGLRPAIMGEFDDSALMNVFGQDGLGIYVVPSAMETDVVRRHGAGVVGRIDAVRQRFYAITVERRLKHPAVVAISDGARNELF